ncbi:hypothetical protein pipiens_013735 [Culex pipiens pipiens]|uniref:Uncharacterized protein n=1 Tax=Culex pipiens pipiens TaxID=38569 RepID=A0ABD1CYH1_CULPP
MGSVTLNVGEPVSGAAIFRGLGTSEVSWFTLTYNKRPIRRFLYGLEIFAAVAKAHAGFRTPSCGTFLYVLDQHLGASSPPSCQTESWKFVNSRWQKPHTGRQLPVVKRVHHVTTPGPFREPTKTQSGQRPTLRVHRA